MTRVLLVLLVLSLTAIPPVSLILSTLGLMMLRHLSAVLVANFSVSTLYKLKEKTSLFQTYLLYIVFIYLCFF